MIACRTLVDENLKPMLGLAYTMLGDVTEAEDMAQEAFLKLWKQAPKWRPDAKVKVWLYRVVHNLCIDHLRKTKRLSGQETPDVEGPDNPERDFLDGQVSETVTAALLTLPPRQRAAITLVHLQEERNIEAAEIMDITVDALESLLARGRRALKQSLEHQKENLIGGV